MLGGADIKLRADIIRKETLHEKTVTLQRQYLNSVL